MSAELDAIAAKPADPDNCLLCGRRSPGGPRKVLLLEAPMCAGHRDEQVRVIREYENDHPGGEHTDACGCMTLEQLKEKLGMD